MHTYRTTISSFLVAAMSMYACLLLTDAPALAQQAAAFNKSQSTDLTQGETQTLQSDAHSKRSAKSDKRPLKDLLKRVFDLQQRGVIDLDSPLEIIIEGDRDSQGLIHNVEITQNSGDAALKGISEEFVTALNESRALDFLSEAKRVRLEVASSKANLAAHLSYEAESAQDARNKARAYKLLLFVAAQSKQGRDEALIYKGLNVSSKDREVIANFSMPRETFCALLSKYLSSN